MRFFIIDSSEKHKGADEFLTATEKFDMYGKKTYEMLLDHWFRLIEITDRAECFEEYLGICRILKDYGIGCEVICYDEGGGKIKNIFGHGTELLGLDMACEEESWLTDGENRISGLNENGLFPDLESALSADIPHSLQFPLSPLYIYRVAETGCQWKELPYAAGDPTETGIRLLLPRKKSYTVMIDGYTAFKDGKHGRVSLNPGRHSLIVTAKKRTPDLRTVFSVPENTDLDAAYGDVRSVELTLPDTAAVYVTEFKKSRLKSK